MTDQIHAPWTPEQVAALNEFQRRGGMHPFTCGGKHRYGGPTLVAHSDGWHCAATYCDYRQDWAHAFMADPKAWPKPFGERHGPTPEEVRTWIPGAATPTRTTPDNPAASSDTADNPLRVDAEAWRRKAIRRALTVSKLRGTIDACTDLADEQVTDRTGWGDGYRAAIGDLRAVLQEFGYIEPGEQP